MPQTIQVDGKDVEVFTKEELEQQAQAAVSKFKEDNPDVSQDLEKLEAQFAAKEKELEGLKSKDLNFSTLRSQVDGLKKELETKVAAAKKEVLEGVLQDHFNDTVKALSRGDEEVQKKIEFHYKRIQDVAATKEEVNKKLTDAWVLATKPESQDVLNTSVISSGGVARIRPRSGVQQFSPQEKELARKMAASVPGLDIKLEDKDFDRAINITRGERGTFEQI